MEFDYMYKDTLCTHVMCDGNNIKIENKVKNISLTAFGVADVVTPNDVYDLLCERCFPETRVNCSELLEDMGIQEYDPIEIIKQTHGAMCSDYFWIRLKENQELSYKDIDPRLRVSII